MPSDFPELWIAALILLCAASVQGFLGFGFGMAAMSGLTLSHDLVHAAGIVNVTGGVLTLVMVWHLRDAVLWRTVARIIPTLALGVVVGVTALGYLDRLLMVRALGITIVGIAVWNLLAPRLHTHASLLADATAGFLGGVLGGAFNTGGPPLIAHLYRRADEPLHLKATIQAVFLGISVCRAPVAAASGLLGSAIWLEAALLLPVALVGLWLGDRLSRRVAPERFRRMAWTTLGVLGLVLLLRA